MKTSIRKGEGFFLIDAVRILGAVLLPPLCVYLTVGFGGQFWLSRYWHVLIDFLTAKPRKEEELRGRAV